MGLQKRRAVSRSGMKDSKIKGQHFFEAWFENSARVRQTVIPDQVLNDKIAFGKFFDDIEPFYFSSNHGSCSSEVKK